MAEKRVVPPRMNIYTVLALVSFILLTVTVCFVWNSSIEMTKGDQPNDGSSPWYVVPATADGKTVADPSGE